MIYLIANKMMRNTSILLPKNLTIPRKCCFFGSAVLRDAQVLSNKHDGERLNDSWLFLYCEFGFYDSYIIYKGGKRSTGGFHFLPLNMIDY